MTWDVIFTLSFFILDINECEIEGSCSQICINEKGTYKCECQSGYLRDPQDHTRCKAMEGHASLLFSMQHNIRKISLDHHEMSAIINSTKSATAIDFVFRTGMIFWGDVSEKKIYKYKCFHTYFYDFWSVILSLSIFIDHHGYNFLCILILVISKILKYINILILKRSIYFKNHF